MKRNKKNRKFLNKHSFHFGKLFPNIITILGLCLGLSAIRFALLEKWEIAVAFIVIAAFVDGMDGRIARMLNSTSSFGAQLDSLCDLINFGISPALVVYLWKTHEMRGIGWAIVLFFVVCAAIRLARFNTDLDESHNTEWSKHFFVGIPSPAAAGLSLLPLILTFFFNERNEGETMEFFFTTPQFVGIYVSIIAILMISRIPTFSVKKLAIRKKELVVPTLLLAALFTIAFIVEPWLTLPIMGFLYIISIPLSILMFYKEKFFKK